MLEGLANAGMVRAELRDADREGALEARFRFAKARLLNVQRPEAVDHPRDVLQATLITLIKQIEGIVVN